MSAATIDIKIAATYKQSEVLYKAKSTWQKDIDDMLDRMNELNSYLTSLHKLLLSLTFNIEHDMKGFKQSITAHKNLGQLVALCVKMLNVVRKSDLYPGVKTSYHSLKEEISYLNELANDRKVALELEADSEMGDIINATIKAAKRK
jgi:sugar phosphate isomerase/epimerase